MARISVRDIKPILQKYGADNLSRYSDIDYSIEDTAAAAVLPNSTKAYKLFSEGKSPLQVSIELNLRAPEVKTLYKEYWELRRMRSLAKLYDEIGDRGISSFLQLHRSCKAQQISNEQIIQFLTIYGNDLPMIKRQYDDVDCRLQALLSQTYRNEKEFEDINIRISMSLNLLQPIQAKCEKAERERNSLAIQKLRLLNFISEFKNNNSMFTKIERFIQEKVNVILRNNMKLLELSLMSALKAFKDDPNTYTYLFQKSDFALT
ncbi:MAG TPA: hypothetical protein VE130_14260 [Nitrososphaeraceae archaeon]|jgi:hypothetical protein|nr:hypothetical protein [Nitrososphaeraceae archaeon]